MCFLFSQKLRVWNQPGSLSAAAFLSNSFLETKAVYFLTAG
jgi:hypothetical protein